MRRVSPSDVGRMGVRRARGHSNGLLRGKLCCPERSNSSARPNARPNCLVRLQFGRGLASRRLERAKRVGALRRGRECLRMGIRLILGIWLRPRSFGRPDGSQGWELPRSEGGAVPGLRSSGIGQLLVSTVCRRNGCPWTAFGSRARCVPAMAWTPTECGFDGATCTPST